MSTLTYSVPGMTCGHCVNAVTSELTAVAGVTEVSVDLATKLVVVSGTNLENDELRAAIEEAGFEPAP
jgi:copper chaperone